MSTTYWEELGRDGSTYQMGEQTQRLAILEALKDFDCQGFLDVGCGTGPMYEIIKENDIPLKYKGVDYSSSFIKTCKREFPETQWEVQDARKLKEGDNSWDAVVLLHSLDHIFPYEEALKEAKRVARKLVIIVLWRPFVTTEKSNINSKNQDFSDSHLIDFSKAELDAVITDIGFRVIDEHKIDEQGKWNYMYILGGT